MARTLRRLVTQETIDRYGRLNGDNDIIHYDESYARARGVRGPIAHGLMVMGYAAELAAGELGPAWFRGGRIHVKWVGPVCPGDEVIVTLGDDGALRAAVAGSDVMVGEAG